MYLRRLIEKWRHNRAESDKISVPVAVAVFASIISLALIAGIARWSWLLMDEQIRLRQEFENLKGSQEQLNIQYEFWSNQLQKERAEIDKMNP